MSSETNWAKAIQPLLRKYKNQKHPLDYQNIYQLVVMVVLSARDADIHINQLAPKIFESFPDMKALSKTNAKALSRALKGVRGGVNKANWLLSMAKTLKDDQHILFKMEQLIELPGIGRKSANVILREAGAPFEGVMVDLHVVRVALRLGIADSSNPKKIEEEIMHEFPRRQWGAGMAMSFLGREICRPKPKCEICLMKKVCKYYQSVTHRSSRQND